MLRLCSRTCRALRARMHQLEPRLLLAQVGWDGEGNDGLWNTPLNWSTDHVPDANDDVRIDLQGTYTVTLAGAMASIASLGVGSAVAGSQRLVVTSRLSLSAPSVLNKTGILELNAGGELLGNVQVTEGRV